MTVIGSVSRWWSSLHGPPPHRIVAAVSGGCDSTALAVALADVLADQGVVPADRLVIAHFNHRTRAPEEHDADRKVVAALAWRLRVPVAFGRADAPVGRDGGMEAAARRARYRFLEACARAVGASVVCTGHTADDQVETLLMRLLKGPGPAQLGGIPRRRVGDGLSIERPMLNAGRADALALLRGRAFDWREDESNSDRSIRRNLVRHEILPCVEEAWPAVRHDLLVAAAALDAERERVRSEAAKIPVMRLFDCNREPAVAIDRARFFAASHHVRLELLYRLITEIGGLDARDRPSRRFFAPLMGTDPGGDATLRSARNLSIRLSGRRVVISRRIVRVC